MTKQSKEVEVRFKNISIANYDTVSLAGQWDLANGYSMTSAVTLSRTFNPATATTVQLGAVLAALLTDLSGKRP